MSRSRRPGSNTSMCASSSTTRSTLPRNEPPGLACISASGEHHRVSASVSVSAAHTRFTSATISIRCAYPRVLSAMGGFYRVACALNPLVGGGTPLAHEHAHYRQHRYQNDEDRDDAEIVLDEWNIAEQVA